MWCLLALPGAAQAVSSDISVQQMVGGDTNPPSVPVIVSVVPVVATQINIAWSPSVDDVALSGYTITRNGAHIATTTLTSFSDTGLLPETLYEYTVRAFDLVKNFSTSSLPVATTTLAVPGAVTGTPTTTDQQGTSGSGKLMLRSSVTVTTDVSSANFAWTTSRPARFELRFGRTTSYELGFVATERYAEKQATVLTDLMSRTKYYYELIGYNTINDIPQLLSRGEFTTAAPEGSVFVPNVTQLTVRAEGQGAALFWKNFPSTSRYSIRVVRNHLRYPVDISDGVVIYQGQGENFFDAQALLAFDRQYYSVFVVDEGGNVSSGAIASIVKQQTQSGGEGLSVVLVPSVTAPPVVLPGLNFSDITLRQGEVVQAFSDEVLQLSAEQQFTVSIRAGALPRQLKSIIATILHPTDQSQSYSFLLRLNAEETAYEATVAPLVLIGVSKIMVEVYDYGEMVVGRYGKQVEFVSGGYSTVPAVVFPDAFVVPLPNTRAGQWVGIVIAFTTAMWLFARRRKKSPQH